MSSAGPCATLVEYLLLVGVVALVGLGGYRAFGTLLSGSLVSTVGACFRNDTGVPINQVTVGYTGEQWRLGTAGRNDRLDFQWSLDAVSLTTGTWTDADALDFPGGKYARVATSELHRIWRSARAQIRPTYLWNLERMARRQQAWRERTYRGAKRAIELRLLAQESRQAQDVIYDLAQRALMVREECADGDDPQRVQVAR